MNMRKSEVYIKQYPHGFNDGFWYVNGKCPPLTTSSWWHNNFVVSFEYEEDSSSEQGA